MLVAWVAYATVLRNNGLLAGFDAAMLGAFVMIRNILASSRYFVIIAVLGAIVATS